MSVLGILGWAVGGVLGLWFLVTVLGNIPSLRGRLTRHDPGGFVPNWGLFARPRLHDIVLLQRDVLADGTLATWRELDIDRPRGWFAFIWNPGLGPRRALLALGDSVVRNAGLVRRPAARQSVQGSPGARAGMFQVPYLVLLGHVTRGAHPTARAVQFMIVAVSGQVTGGRHDLTATARVLFVSEIHAIYRGGHEPPPLDRHNGREPALVTD